uniref:Uncharacterized protein n=1 Tax=Arundo donax TaxID=35708 RepID=A0A0A8ZVZ9_ARUDO
MEFQTTNIITKSVGTNKIRYSRCMFSSEF